MGRSTIPQPGEQVVGRTVSTIRFIPVVHIVDAEADSVAHYRLWSEVPGRTFLVRADDRLVEFRGEEQKISVVRETLQCEGCFQFAREVRYRDRPASQWVAEVPVCLLRAGQQNRLPA